MLKPDEHEFLQAYFDSLPPEEVPEEVTVRAGMATDKEGADYFLDLILDGTKWAASGLAADYTKAGDALPAVGDFWIVLDSQENPACLLRTKAVEKHAFKDVPERIAVAEGDGDLSLAHWREAHRAYFTPFLEHVKIKDLDSAEVITEFYELLFEVMEPFEN